MASSDRSTPLLELHRSLGARLTQFAGWDMPLQYEGIVAEHRTIREAAGVFDVSHLGKLTVSGPGAGEALQHALTCDVLGLEVGMARYGLVLTEDAGCVDDVFVYRLANTEWLCVPNAANVGAVAGAIESSGGTPEDRWDTWAILALQGPKSFDVFAEVWPESEAPGLKLHAWTHLSGTDSETIVARTGYTGERGFEIYCPSADAERVFRSLLDAGAKPVGLGARDTLRLEMGYALYGHEIDIDTDPLSAGLGWAVAWDTDFRGKEALLEIKRSEPPKKLFGIMLTDRGVPRDGYPVWRGEDEVGVVVSGNFSPTLGTGIAQAYAARDRVPAVGEHVEVEARGRRLRGDIVKPPFIERS